MENSLQTITTNDSTLTLKTALPALLTNVRINGARNLAESSVEAVALALEGIVKDPILSKFPFDQASFVEIVYRVIKSGTVLERSALAKHLTPKAACLFPSVKRQTEESFENIQSIIEQVLKPMFKILADHFGVNFVGDADSVAYSIIQEYGGLSVADFLIFFERAKTRRYVLEYQHVASRGINADFLFSWLDQYVQEKVDAEEEIYQKFKNPDETVVDDQSLENAQRLKEIRLAFEQKQRERAELLSRAQNMRIEYELNLYESVLITQFFKFQDVEVIKAGDEGILFNSDGTPTRVKVRQEVICSADDPDKSRSEVLPFRVPKDGSIDRLTKRAIFEFVTFGKSKETEELFDAYKNRVWDKYKTEDGNIEQLVNAELKHTLTLVSAIKRSLDVIGILYADLERKGVKGSPIQIRRYVSDTLQGFEQSYFDEYLPYCFRVNCPPMTKDEYNLSVVLEYVVSQGQPNPIKSLFE